MQNLLHDKAATIVAEGTPPGRGGVSMVRVSGPLVSQMMRVLFEAPLTPHHATYVSFKNEQQDIIDHGIALFFKAPHSFTGEDVLELHCHGSPIVVAHLIQRVVQLGARLAKPGEFSERAFLNHKIDLTQAEAIADLIAAHSERAAMLAMRSLTGDFSRAIHAIEEKIIEIRLHLEAMIDFSEENIETLQLEKLAQKLQEVIFSLEKLQASAKEGHRLQTGITCVITGKPNVGKSSLLNALSDKETAIVTNIPGTTRDLLKDTIILNGMPIHLIDTAGMRESDDPVEQEGIRRAKQAIKEADLCLTIQDATETTVVPVSTSAIPQILIRNKIDLTHEPPTCKKENDQTIIALSAKTRAGIDLLKQAILAQAGLLSGDETLFLARARHLDALRQAVLYLQAASDTFYKKTPELLAEDLRLAQRSLNEVKGEFTTEDLLGKIFSTFCVGK